MKTKSARLAVQTGLKPEFLIFFGHDLWPNRAADFHQNTAFSVAYVFTKEAILIVPANLQVGQRVFICFESFELLGMLIEDIH